MCLNHFFDIWLPALGIKIEAEPKHDRPSLHGSMGEVFIADIVIVQIFDGEVCQKASVCKLMASQIDFKSFATEEYVVLSPLLSPLLSLKGDGEGPSHLNSAADRQFGGGFVVEEAEDFVVEVHRSASHLDSCEEVVLFHRNLLHAVD